MKSKCNFIPAQADLNLMTGPIFFGLVIWRFGDKLRWKKSVALSKKERARYEKYSFHLFDLFMARFETIKDKESTNLPKIKDASTKFLALSRHLLSYCPQQ